MAIKSTKQMKSLHTFTNAQIVTQTLANRWWVDPRVVYLHRRDVDVEIIRYCSRPSQNAVAKLAEHIRGLSQVAKEGNGSSMVLSMSDLARIFH
jgi:tRNA A58 N-methylase Trm61